MAGLTKKGKVYYALFTTNGKTKWIRIGKVSYQDARKLLKKLESDHDFIISLNYAVELLEFIARLRD